VNKGDIYTKEFFISQDIYNGFINLFRDENPLHVNNTFAQEKGFDGKVMHGNILNGFVSYFIGECLPLKNVIIQTQEIKYMKPVYLNDQLIFHAEVEDVFESVRTVEFKFYFEKINKVKVARGKIQIGILE
jgi:3-hydroxybutyryl-CoA dehydratase